MTTIDEAEVAKFTALAARDDISSLIAVFEEAILFDDNKNEYWLARQLQVLLGYTNWQNFSLAIERAKQACLLSKHDIENHFIEVFTEASKNSSGGRPSSDYHLSRYACYLIAQNSDSRKKQVAFLFRATQAEEKLIRDKIKGKNAANNAHLEVGKKVREAIKDIGGTMPENLPVAEDIKKVTRRVAKTLTQKDEP
jgi:DNA-damage-inducible protein D